LRHCLAVARIAFGNEKAKTKTLSVFFFFSLETGQKKEHMITLVFGSCLRYISVSSREREQIADVSCSIHPGK
jgi:hypothetical protein